MLIINFIINSLSLTFYFFPAAILLLDNNATTQKAVVGKSDTKKL